MVPAALVPRLREHLPQGRPEAERSVADGEHRRAETAIAEVAQDVGPGVGALTVAELHRQELLAAVGPGADHHQQAAVLYLGADAEVDAV